MEVSTSAQTTRAARSQVALARESFDAVINEAMPLVREHYREVAHYQDIPLDVDYAGYSRMERLGLLRVYTARIDGALVGYAAFALIKNPHYASSPPQAKQDVFYVAPTSRGRFIGLRLLRYCDEQLRAEGVQVVYHHYKIAHPLLGLLLKRCGYKDIDIMAGKRLDLEER